MNFLGGDVAKDARNCSLGFLKCKVMVLVGLQ